MPLHLHGRSLPRARNAARLPLLIVAATLALACGGDSPSGPSASTSPVGNYQLSTYNGKAVPATVFADSGFRLALASGSLNLAGDGSYLAILSMNETVEGHLSVYVDSAMGRWTQTGTTMVFAAADSTKQTATYDGARITLSDTTTIPPSTFVFARK